MLIVEQTATLTSGQSFELMTENPGVSTHQLPSRQMYELEDIRPSYEKCRLIGMTFFLMKWSNDEIIS